MRFAGERDVGTALVTTAFFAGTFLLTLALHQLCSSRSMYHEGDFRARKSRALTEYKVTVSTGLGLNSGVEEDVQVCVCVRGEKSGRPTQTEWSTDWSKKRFKAGESASQTIECHDLGKIGQVDLKLVSKQEEAEAEAEATEETASAETETEKQRWLCASVEVCNMGPHKNTVFEAEEWVVEVSATRSILFSHRHSGSQ